MSLVKISQAQGRIPVTVFHLQERVNLGNFAELEETAKEAYNNGMRDLVIDLGETVAYADSTSDLPMLEAVGFPVAVNPETRLAALARKRGWLVEHFAKAPGGPRTLVPIGPRRTRTGGLYNPLVPDGVA